MRLTHILGFVCVAALSITPVLAQDAMKAAAPGMMASDTVMAVMPDGHMGSMMMTDDAMTTKMMGMSTPVASCVMMMTDKDGKMYMVDTSSAEAKAECEKLAMSAPAM
jgi:hypothetical protein